MAVVGVSHDPKDFSRNLLGTLSPARLRCSSVNPGSTSADGAPYFARLTDVLPYVGGALLMTSPAVTDAIVQECARLPITRVWMYRAGGKGAVSAPAIEFCHDHGIAVVPGECPYMFLQGESWFHRFHGFIRKTSGAYPA